MSGRAEKMDIVVDVHVHFGRINPQLDAWLIRTGLPVRRVYGKYDVCTARRQSLANFLHVDVPAGRTHLIQIDEDMVPDGRSDAILSAPGDLVFCGYPGRLGRPGHYGDGDFGAGFCRISAGVAMLEGAATAFKFGYADDARTSISRCECRSFGDWARAQGVPARMVGVVGHLVDVVAWPVGPDGCELVWPAGA